jgi:hypothetical protein
MTGAVRYTIVRTLQFVAVTFVYIIATVTIPFMATANPDCYKSAPVFTCILFRPVVLIELGSNPGARGSVVVKALLQTGRSRVRYQMR